MGQEPVEFIDFAALRQHVANYDSLFLKLLELFVDQAPLWIQEINEAFASQDPALLRHACHKIKGGAGTLQAQAILDAAADLNRYAVAGDLSGAEASRDLLVSVIDGTIAFVRDSGHLAPKC